MQCWKLAKTLSHPKDPQWEILVKDALGEALHPDRKLGFLLSREALKLCLKEQHYDLAIGQLKLGKFHQLLSCPQFTISLSHTAGWGAALLADRNIFQGVGIDVEHEERVVKASIMVRIAHPGDVRLRNIELWCLKEAVFKALMNTDKFQKPLDFSSLEISQEGWSHSPSGLSGHWELDLVKSLVIARAFLKN
jgi:hypothetical protein